MPKDYPRSGRIEKLAREVLGEAIQGLKDPRVGFATVTSVKMSPDLRTASVFVSVLGSDEQRRTSIEAITHAAPHLRSIFGQEIRMKFLPRLEIIEDTSAIEGERIDSLLRQASTTPPTPKDEDE